MYTDYPIVHETFIRNYPLIITISVIVISIIVFYIIMLGKIFKKAGENPFLALIPIVNVSILIKIADIPRINTLLFFIPIINIYTFIILASELSKRFGKDKSFKFLLFFLPFIYYPVLALSKDKYVGINNESVKEIYLDEKIIEQAEVKATKVIKKDQNINMGTNIKTPVNENTETDIELKADVNVLDQSLKGTNLQYIECPNCHNKVKKGVAVCFFCGTNLKDVQNSSTINN